MQTNKVSRNQSMDFAKLIASFFVVFIHVPFPGDFGEQVRAFARFAVPFFFAASGFFCYQVSSEKLFRRFLHILKLNALAMLIYVVWDCLMTEYTGGSTVSYLRSLTPNQGWLVHLLVLSEHPFFEYDHGHLWYLVAAATCYLYLWIYVRFFGEKTVNYRPLYIIGFCLCFLHMFINEFALACDVYFPLLMYRNAQLFGLPMFALGLFLREYQQTILSNYGLTAKRLILLIGVSVWVCMQEWEDVGNIELYMSSILTVIGVLLLTAGYPQIPLRSKAAEKMVSAFGSVSTWIYILHMILLDIYERFLQTSVYNLFPTAEPWLKPLIVLLLSLTAAVIFTHVQNLLKKRKSKQKEGIAL